jgi:hypothetical protein
MNRFSRINTIWRKELIDTLRDRRTLIAMILVPMIALPGPHPRVAAGFRAADLAACKQEEQRVVVAGEAVRVWLQDIDLQDAARRPGAAEAGPPRSRRAGRARRTPRPGRSPHRGRDDTPETAQAERPPAASRPKYVIEVVPNRGGRRRRWPPARPRSACCSMAGCRPWAPPSTRPAAHRRHDQTEIRSQIAAAGLEGILQRKGDAMLLQRLEAPTSPPSFIQPIQLRAAHTATPEKVGGSILGQIVPLILIVMTITGAIYPAIDLTAGERERGTLETLMVAPVPTVDLIAGKFVVVALIGMLSAALNLLSIGGTIYLGGLGDILTQGAEVVIPLGALPWVLLLLIPLAVMFSALLLAVCSFARSFKEAQNYVMPVMVAALIPAVVGTLPGTEARRARS